MPRVRSQWLMGMVCLIAACSDQSGFNGGGGTDKEVNANSAPAVAPTPTPAPNPIPTPTPAPTPPINFQPNNVVDGQEVYNDCSRCLMRAQQLSQQQGFMADMSRSVNMGFYKIPQNQNLCDIHFMADLNLPIDDHEGVDTIGNGQIILYCPCNCGWAVDGAANQPPPFF